ncbi:hypothetical protein DH2020_024437 [Rehmannia glutinosa]|uniref:DUF7755 domain-containing protein n=1 Tax=Rehmannia glutinosa TaxID=99300 RepID=A0ABR0W563_REHGL
MESLSSRFLISSAHTRFPATYSINPLRIKTLATNFQYFPLTIHSKKSSYQVLSISSNQQRGPGLDFQEYVKPSQLLPAKEAKVCTDASVEKAFASFLSGGSDCLFKVKLQTSKIYGSGLSDVNSGILLCLIDVNGSSILQRLPATSVGTDAFSEDKDIYDTLHFQRGSVDEFAFEGPNLGRIVAVWISLESVFFDLPLAANGRSMENRWHEFDYYFSLSTFINWKQPRKQTPYWFTVRLQVQDILIGENSEASIMEFRPHSITAFSNDESTLFSSLNPSPSLDNYLTSNEESMKEYTYLKFSLLFYDAMLILAGSSVAYFWTGENAPYAFLTGGLCGFFYLLLLQRSVDGLPAQELVPSENKGNFGQIFDRLKGPISSLALAFAFAIIILKYASGEDAVKLTPKEIMFGMMGFLMCKVSVVLAAFKPIPLILRGNERSP